jgi:hypothetical protein
MSDELSGALATLLDDVSVERELAAVRVQPDLGDVLARARRLDPTRALDRLARVGDLDALVAGAHATIARAAENVERSAVAPIVWTRPARGARWAALAAIAAAVLLAVGLGLGLRARVLDASARPDYSGANQTAEGDAWSEAAIETPPARPPRAATTPRAPIVAPSVPAPAPIATPVDRREPARKRVVVDELAAIDREARAAWKRGDLAAAEAGFEALVRRGGRRSLVDLAFGDLFELARQRGDAAKDARLWRRYVERFPTGRYADEARAGLCRRPSGGAATACWQRYIDERPNGTYREQARAALGARPSSPR